MLVSKGSVIAGRYRAERRVGAGGMGEVWEGEHLALGSRVAIKTLLEGGEDNPELIARFRREAKLLGRCRSDHVARVVDFLEDPEIGLVLIMEFVEGRSLSAVLEGKTLNIDEGLDLAIDLATALADLHRAKIVHRDIKPGNIIMQPTSSGAVRAVLVDFGISRIEGHNEEDSLTGITRADIALGTVEYMAPEQILNSRQVTAASDVYAVGAILFRALSGRHVFGDRREEALARAKLIDEPPPLKVGGVDPTATGLCEVVDKALKKRPANRLASGERMLDLLLPLRNDRSRSEWDEETTTDGARTIAREFVAPAPVDPRASDPRASMASIPPGGLAAVAGPPSGRGAPRGELDPGRRSLSSVEIPHVAEARPRAASMAEMPIEAQRARLPWGPMALAIATALAVGAAIAVALTPQPPPPVESAASPASSSASLAAAGMPAPCPTVAAVVPEPIDIDEPAAIAAASASAAPKAAPTATAVALAPKPTAPAAPAAPPPPKPPTTVAATAPPKPPPPKPPPTSDPYGGAPSPDGALRSPPTPAPPPPAPPPPERPRPPVDTELF